mmetsp:Transcript_15640/g.46169  ORF Transcript_15640/g.46169 Transcript_15640/m.46169 type:complete len:118 (-) Transcript_15640:122-475(-)
MGPPVDGASREIDETGTLGEAGVPAAVGSEDATGAAPARARSGNKGGGGGGAEGAEGASKGVSTGMVKARFCARALEPPGKPREDPSPARAGGPFATESTGPTTASPGGSTAGSGAE